MWRAGLCSMWRMCVWGPQSQLPSSRGFSNDRVDFSKLAPVITHDPSVLRFPHCTHPWEGWHPHVSAAFFFSPNISCLMPAVRAKWARGQTPNTATPFFPSHPVRVHSSSLSFTVSFSSSFILPLLKTASLFLKQISCKCFSFSFFFLLVARSFQGNRFLLWSGFLSGSHWSAGNREHKGSRAGF